MEFLYYLNDEDFVPSVKPHFYTIRKFGFSIDILTNQLVGIKDDEIILQNLKFNKSIVGFIIDFLSQPSNSKHITELSKSINQSQIKELNSILDTISSHLKNERKEILISEFKEFSFWLDRFIERVEINVAKSNAVSQKLFSFDPELYSDLQIINKKILFYIERKQSNLKGLITKEVNGLYISKYTEKYKIKKEFYYLVFPELTLPKGWNEKQFVKYCQAF